MKKKREAAEIERKRRLKPFFDEIVNRRDELIRQHKVTHLLTHSLTHLLTHSLTHLLTHLLAH